MSRDDPAFPLDFSRENGGGWNQGLTKRELFAAMAMQGIISDGDPKTMCGLAAVSGSIESGVAGMALNFADALLDELEETKK